MTTYKFEFDIGEMVWTMIGSKAKNVRIDEHNLHAAIHVYRDGNPLYKVNANIGSDHNTLALKHPHELFTTKSKLLESL